MASQSFMDAFYGHIYDALKTVIAGEISVWMSGSDEDQYGKPTMKDRFAMAILDTSTGYYAQEYIAARIPLKIPHLRFIDMVVPAVNLDDNSIPGTATFLGCIPYPVLETYVLRPMIVGGGKLVPYRMVVDNDVSIKKIIKEKMIRNKAIRKINLDGKLCKKLQGNRWCFMKSGLKKFQNEIPRSNGVIHYPLGMFSLIPYHGYTFLVSRDAGVSNEMTLNFPLYDLMKRVTAFDHVARYIMQFPRRGQEEGKYVLDKSLSVLLEPMMAQIDMELEHRNPFGESMYGQESL